MRILILQKFRDLYKSKIFLSKIAQWNFLNISDEKVKMGQLGKILVCNGNGVCKKLEALYHILCTFLHRCKDPFNFMNIQSKFPPRHCGEIGLQRKKCLLKILKLVGWNWLVQLNVLVYRNQIIGLDFWA